MRRATHPRAGIVLWLAVAVSVSVFPGSSFAKAGGGVDPPQTVCEREAKKLPRGRAVGAGPATSRAPKRIRHVSPTYPPFPAGTTGQGIWIGEVLIDSRGKVSQVWTIREVVITPPLPGFNKAITDAVGQWEYTSPQVNKAAVPVCMTVTVNVNVESIRNPGRH
jgi:hypothetical protein